MSGKIENINIGETEKDLLSQISDIENMTKGAYNIRKMEKEQKER